jgi:hypothetical protein
MASLKGLVSKRLSEERAWQPKYQHNTTISNLSVPAYKGGLSLSTRFKSHREFEGILQRDSHTTGYQDA